ncbi:MAG: tetratricopeptide repeat protein [Flavobacteriales bacterium]|nr:tetratricopeptide repeat protein [Flavobacteriales bacterium]
MSEEWNYQGEDERKLLVARYEKMIADDESYFFDIDQFESIIEYYLERNRIKQAQHVLKYAAQLFPDSTVLLLREAQLLASTGKLSRAVPRLKNLLRFEPNNEEVLMTLASVYSQLREHRQAIEYLQTALKTADKELKDEIWIELALEYENLERWDKAIETLTEAIGANPENETALYEIAYCFDMANKTEAGIAYFNKFIDYFPYSFPAWYNLGNMLQKEDKLEESIHAYDYCLVIQEDFTPGILNKANALVKLERYEDAIKEYKLLIGLEPLHASSLCFIGECYERLEQYEDAEKYYRQSLEVDDEFADAWVGLGVIMDLQDMSDAALKFFERALQIEPDNIDFQLLIGASMRKLGMHSEAAAIYENIIRLESTNVDAWLDHSDNRFRMGDHAGALELIREGVTLIHDSIELEYREVAYLYRHGKRKEAYGRLEELLTKDFENSQSLLEYLPEIENDPVVVQLLDLYKPN